MIVLSDFNLLYVSLKPVNDNVTLICNKSRVNKFLEELSNLCLNQINLVPNYFGKILEVILLFCQRMCITLFEIGSNFLADNSTLSPSFRFNFLKYWPSYIDNIEAGVLHFNSTVFSLFGKCVPIKTGLKIQHINSWFAKKLCCLKKRRSKVFMIFKRTGLHLHYLKYSSLWRKCLDLDITKVKKDIFHNPKLFYDFFNSKREFFTLPSIGQSKYFQYFRAIF